jgi:hypothetical protein
MKDFKGDKRTKEYKEWKKNFEANNSKGLGDTIEKITEATGIKKIVKFVAGEDCGCDERKKKLNEIFRYKKIECLEEYEYIFLKHWFKRNTNIVTNKNQKDLLKIYNRVFGTKKNTSSCSSCVRSMVKELEKIYNNYK